jgi:POT family proton-dependent oligopeptide transporter
MNSNGLKHSVIISYFNLALSFIIIWGIAIWKVNNDYNSSSYVVEYLNNNGEIETSKVVSSNNYQNGAKISIKDNETINIYNSNDTINKGKTIKNNILYSPDNKKISEAFTGKVTKIFKEDKIGAGIQISKAEPTQN